MPSLYNTLHSHTQDFAYVVPFEPLRDRLFALDLTAQNKALTENIIMDAEAMTAYITDECKRTGTRYAIGGYNEHRTIYGRSEHFGTGADEPRRLHLGTDIWGGSGTPVFAPLAGEVHSFSNNAAFGDYGGTIILHHRFGEAEFHTLYGHLSVASLEGLHEGKAIAQGAQLATFGEPSENGGWSPHLHFQVIVDMEGMKGDYPGVCRLSERERYLQNCPNPDRILGLSRFVL